LASTAIHEQESAPLSLATNKSVRLIIDSVATTPNPLPSAFAMFGGAAFTDLGEAAIAIVVIEKARGGFEDRGMQ